MSGRPAHRAARLLILPGLHDSGPGHWQSWLEQLSPGALRVRQADWARPDLTAWSARIDATLAAEPPGHWLAVAHSFGCLALAEHLGRRSDSPIVAALLVAPADPVKFGVAGRLQGRALPLPSVVVGSGNDPWMRAEQAQRWARGWGSHWIHLGDAGHINAEAGFARLPLARRWAAAMTQRIERSERPPRASVAEWSFAI